MKQVQFKQWNCLLDIRHYENNRTALLLIDAEDHSPVATATVNLPDVELKSNEVIIKDYSENEGMLAALIAAGIVGKPIWYAKTGFVTCPICPLLV